MAAKKQTRPEPLSSLEVWALAQVVARKPLPSNLALSPSVLAGVERLSIIAYEWRGQVLQEMFGQANAALVMQLPTNAPRPMNVALAQPAPKSNAPQFALVTEVKHLILADELKNLPIPRYSLDEYPIYASGLNMLVGPSGGGKSFIAVDVTGLIVTKEVKEDKQPVVVYIAGEGLFGYSSRWEVWKDKNGIHEQANAIFYDEPVNFLDETEFSKFIDEITPHSPTLIIVDTVATCMSGFDENSTRDMGMFVSACRRLQFLLNAGVLLVHHTGKDGTARGSSALYGACDSVMFLQSSEGSMTLYNSRDQGGKNKYAPSAEPIHKVLVPRMVEVDGKVFDSCFLAPAAQVVMNKSEAIKLSVNQRLILEALDGYRDGLKPSQLIEMTTISSSSLFHTLKTMKIWKWVDVESDKYLITEEGVNVLSN